MAFEKKELLLVDDQALTRYATRIVAEELGYQVDECESGAQTIARLAQKHYGIILLDYDMPAMDGAQCAGAIREMINFDPRQTALFCLTASSDADTRRKCLEAGVDCFLSRPCTTEKLTAAIENWSNKIN